MKSFTFRFLYYLFINACALLVIAQWWFRWEPSGIQLFLEATLALYMVFVYVAYSRSDWGPHLILMSAIAELMILQSSGKMGAAAMIGLIMMVTLTFSLCESKRNEYVFP